jgi:two-component system, OmpR family, sensor kinase
MFRSLYSKLAAVLAGLFLIIGLFFVALTVFSTSMYQQEVNQKLNIHLADQIVSGKILLEGNRVRSEALDEVFDTLMIVNPGIELYLLDMEGNILSFSAPEGKVKRDHVDLGPIQKCLEGDTKTPILGDDPRSSNGKKIFSVAPIYEDGIKKGFLYVILGGELYDNVVQQIKGSYIIRLSAWMMVAGLLFSLIAGLILFALLTGRLKKLAIVMDEFRKGKRIDTLKIQDKISIKKADEIDQLSSTFMQMAERIQDQMQELRKSDSLRRELVANVSHDLRTPLATLQGYIETLIIKEDSFGAEERRKYLNIAIDHCKRLSRLVSELLELARLESLEIEVKKEPFNISELAHDVVQKFRLKAEEKGISVEITVEKDLPFVFADIGLIERVLENLIENAIHYTPDGGSINADIKKQRDEVLMKISDTGVGIPKEQLPNIFDRFYRSDKSKENGFAHSGLGLAIAKRILDLHERTIDVSSEIGVGTAFSFTLPAF